MATAKNIVDTNLPIEFSDVCEVINQDFVGTNGRRLFGATGQFTVAESVGIFDPTYSGSKDRLSNFRGYKSDYMSVPYFQWLNGTYTLVGSKARDVWCKPDGKTMYILNDSHVIQTITLTTAWDLTTVHSWTSYDYSSSSGDPYSLNFNPTGTKLYISVDNSDTNQLIEYTLSPAWNIPSMVKSTFLTLQDPNPRHCEFSDDGTKVWSCGASDNEIELYTLSTPWSVATGTKTSTKGGMAGPAIMWWSSTGQKFFKIGSFSRSKIEQIKVATPYGITSTHTADGEVFTGYNLDGIHIDYPTGYMIIVTNNTASGVATLRKATMTPEVIIRPSDVVLTLVSVTTSTVSLSWTQATGVNLVGYYIYDENDTLIQTITDINTLSYTFSGVSAGTYKGYQIKAYNQSGVTSLAFSNLIWTSTLTIAPTLTTGAVTSSSIVVNRNSVTGGSSYILEWRVSGGSWAIATSAMGTAYTKTGLTVGTTYEFRCKVQNSDGGIGAYSNTLTQAITSVPPVTPTILEVEVFYNAFSIRVSSAADASVTQIEVSAIGEFEGERGGISSWTADGFGHWWTSPLDLITDQEFIIKARYKNAGGTVGNWSNTIVIYTDPRVSTL